MHAGPSWDAYVGLNTQSYARGAADDEIGFSSTAKPGFLENLDAEEGVVTL